MYSKPCLLFLAAMAAVKVACQNQTMCGMGHPGQKYHELAQKFAIEEAAKKDVNPDASTSSVATATNIKTYIHVIASNPNFDGVTEDLIHSQMDVLNSNFDSSGFQFSLQDIDWVNNASEASLANQNHEYEVKQKYRRGSYQDLNLYYHTKTWVGNTGWSQYPKAVSQGSYDFYMDGCTMVIGTLPGGSYAPWNEGKITTHEVGHWLGLIHTFGDDQIHGGCYGYGDGVDDTPASYSASYGCDLKRDSCPSLPGLDPVHNYMDYSDNSCQNAFTAGQIQRMRSWFDYYRSTQ